MTRMQWQAKQIGKFIDRRRFTMLVYLITAIVFSFIVLYIYVS
jgi:hypothetical protein